MFDAKLRPVIDGPLNAAGRRLAALGVGADHVTIAVFCAFCLWPAGFPWLAGGFAVLCSVSATSRVLAGWRTPR